MAVTKKIKQNLALAASALLGDQAIGAEQKAEEVELYNDWNVDVGYLYYKEADYITVDTYMAMIDGSLSDKDTVKLGLVFDTLTGSTPTGALPGNSDTFTSVSGGAGGSVGSTGGSVPFDDTRLAINANWNHEWERLIRSNVSAYVSVEGDYTAIGGGLGIEKDTEDKAYTFSAAIGGSSDTVSQSNEQTPEPLTVLSDGLFNGKGHKNTIDVLFGMTKVINRRTAAMLNLSYSASFGYHTDPYKVVSVTDEDDAEYDTIFEKRPDERERFILFGKIVHELPETESHLDFSYRYHQDSWELVSHTFEGSYSFKMNEKNILKPFGRLYHQQAANFYERTLISQSGGTDIESDLPEFISSDPRLGEMLSVTAGVKYTYKTSATGSIDTRLAYIYRQYENAVIDNRDAIFFTVDLGKAFN